MNPAIGKTIISIGVVVVLVGVVFYFFGDKLRFLGNLPGDIRIEKDNFSFYFPITTMVILSVLLNLILKLYRYFQS